MKYVGDGVPGGYDQLTNYKQVTVTVLRTTDSLQLAQDVTYVAPPTKADGSLAAIDVSVLDVGDNDPVSGIPIALQTGPSAPESDTTGQSGSVTFAGLTFNPTTGSQDVYNIVPDVALELRHREHERHPDPARSRSGVGDDARRLPTGDDRRQPRLQRRALHGDGDGDGDTAERVAADVHDQRRVGRYPRRDAQRAVQRQRDDG